MDASLNIGRAIARERRRMGVTQEELASHLGVSKAAVSKWELTQSLPDVSLLPRIAAYFSLTMDELFDWRDELTEGESAALYAEVYALGERDLPAAYARLRELVAEHYSDANLLLMMASLLTTWATGTEAPQGSAAERNGADAGDPSGAPDAAALAGEALKLLDCMLDVAAEPATLFLAQQQKATTLFQVGRYEDAAALLEPLAKRRDAGAAVMLLASVYRKLGRVDAPLWDRMGSRLDPAHAGDAWAEHKTRQAAGAAAVLKQAVAEQVASDTWREFAGGDPRYQEIVAAVQRLVNGEATGHED
ncbi:helix-turn-helix transcriptional regulator [Collinsella sp. An2]|uniref:helix-turn-helix domain-containing protein n=1 Tax=Collinsella sp. An2 TaxID=1965585 RepID=UPI000B3A37A4|nr:helix-turn-helix transcriptional regulator [Collinsella sp. An2]OUP08404.1 hypothetical protein B5F33_06785 [Collinsella sp. An2]